MKSKFVFYFPYRGFGGVPILFLRVAEKLAGENHSVYVVDYADGYMAQHKSSQIQLIEYTDDRPIEIPLKSHLVLQSDLPWGIPTNLKCDNDSRILFWNCYPFNFVPVLPKPFAHFFSSRPFWNKVLLNSLLYTAKQKSRNLVRFLIDNQALVFMDEPNWKFTRWTLDISNLPKRFLPVLLPTKANFAANDLIKPEIINIAWLGRIGDFKIHSVIRILRDLKKIAPTLNKKIRFTIIGSGDYENALKDELAYIKEFEFEILTSIPQKELHHFLNSKFDLLFAMGTSALEGGIAKVPTILMNFSYSPVSDHYRYSFLTETSNFSLGDLITDQNISIGRDLLILLQEVVSNKRNIGEQTYSYVEKHHSLDQHLPDFIKVCETNLLTYNKLIQNCDLAKPTFYKIWLMIKQLKEIIEN